MKYIKYIKLLSITLLFFIFIFAPQTTANLYLRLHFEYTNNDSLQLFYSTATNNIFSEEQSVIGYIDKKSKTVSFCLDKSLCDQITGLRLDFSPQEETMIINGISVSSGGVIKKDINPGDVFSDSNIIALNDLAYTPVPSWHKTYIVTQHLDPYIIFSQSLTQELTDCYSHGYMTRFFVCVFITIFIFLSKKNVFNSTKEL